MRAITVGYNPKSFTLKVYFENNPSEEERELIEDAVTEIAADFPEINDFRKEIEVTKVNPEVLDDWVYMRYEGY